jgi:soluble lytic murein transglycosylase-like protein
MHCLRYLVCLLLLLGCSAAGADDSAHTDLQVHADPALGLKATAAKKTSPAGTSAIEADAKTPHRLIAIAASPPPAFGTRAEAGAGLYVSAQPFEDFLARTEAGAHRWSAVAIAAAAANDIPPDLFLKLLAQESAFKPTAISKAGALGIAQFMPGTAIAVGLRDPFEPNAAIHAAARHLAELRARFGNLGLATAAYNAGPDRVRAWLSGRKALPQETVDYVRRITGMDAGHWAAMNKHTGIVAVNISPPVAAKARGSRKRAAPIVSAAELCQAVNANGSRCTVQRSY